MKIPHRAYSEETGDFLRLTRFLTEHNTAIRTYSTWCIGRFVSGCEALIDAHNCEADIERICTHHAFRKRGFARAVIQECLARLRAMGLCRAYITGYSIEAISLYGSLGAEGEMQAYTWSK